MEGEIKALHPFLCSFLAVYFLLPAAYVRNMEVVSARCVSCEKKTSLARAYPVCTSGGELCVCVASPW